MRLPNWWASRRKRWQGDLLRRVFGPMDEKLHGRHFDQIAGSSTVPRSQVSQSPFSRGTTVRLSCLSGARFGSGLCISLSSGWVSQFCVTMV